MNASAEALVRNLRSHGTRLWLRQGKLCVSGPRELLTVDIESALTACKPDIVAILQPAKVGCTIHSTVFRVGVDNKSIIVICHESVTEESVMPRLLQKFGPGRVSNVVQIS